MLTTNKSIENGTATFALNGWLDTTTAPQFEQDLKGSLEGVSLVILDLNDLEYISSAGLRTLLAAQKRMEKQGDMVIRNANESIMEIFEVTGFSDILTIE